MRIAGIVPESYVDGEGIRFAVFMQGCLRRCVGCQNPSTHDPTGGKLVDVTEVIDGFKSNPLLSGITLTGGEPFLQLPAAVELARAAKSFGLSVWCYTGNTFENLPPSAENFLANVDVLVDGEFVEELRSLDLQFRGSENQRIIDLNATRLSGKLTLWSEKA